MVPVPRGKKKNVVRHWKKLKTLVIPVLHGYRQKRGELKEILDCDVRLMCATQEDLVYKTLKN